MKCSLEECMVKSKTYVPIPGSPLSNNVLYTHRSFDMKTLKVKKKYYIL